MDTALTLHQRVVSLLEDPIDTAALTAPSVGHPAFRRLRLHLPHWSGDNGSGIVGEIRRRFPAATHAEANPVTSNVLILFDPEQTSPTALIQELSTLRPQLSSVLPLHPDQPDRPLAHSELG